MAWDNTQPSNQLTDWSKDFSNNFLIYGESKTGKTFVATCKARLLMEKDAESKLFVVNTDKGFAKPAMQNGLDKFKDRIYYYFVNDIRTAINVINEIRSKAKPNDIIMFDLISWVWDESQKTFVSELSGNNPVSFIKQAMADEKKFGLFAGLQWGYIKKLDDMISNYLAKNPICNIIAIARVKGVEMEYKMSKKKEDVWVEVGRPDGRKDIMFEFSNIIRVMKNDKGSREFMVIGSRDVDTKFEWVEYTTPEDFWTKLQQSGVN